MTGKGFYIAICLSIAVVSVAAYVVINSTRNSINDQNSNNMSIDIGSNEWSFSTTPVDESKSDVPKESSSESQSSEPSNQSTATSASESTSQNTQSFSNTFVMPLKGDIINSFSGENR